MAESIPVNDVGEKTTIEDVKAAEGLVKKLRKENASKQEVTTLAWSRRVKFI